MRKDIARTRQREQAMQSVPTSITDEDQKRQFAGSIARHERHVRGKNRMKFCNFEDVLQTLLRIGERTIQENQFLGKLVDNHMTGVARA